jgi:hypothetical protein
MYSFFAFAFKVCKNCYYEPKEISKMPLMKVKSKKTRKYAQKRKYSKLE